MNGPYYAERVTPRIRLGQQFGRAGREFTVEFNHRDEHYFTNPDGCGLWHIYDYKMVLCDDLDDEGNIVTRDYPEPMSHQQQGEGEFRISRDRRRALRALRRYFTHWELVDDREPTDSMKCGC